MDNIFKCANSKQHFTIRKYHFGAASILLGASLALGTNIVSAAEQVDSGVEVVSAEASGTEGVSNTTNVVSATEQVNSGAESLENDTLLEASKIDLGASESVTNDTENDITLSEDDDSKFRISESETPETSNVIATETTDKSIDVAIKEASEDLNSLENGDNPLFNDTSETSNKFGLPFVVIKDKDTNKILEGGRYHLIALSRDSNSRNINWNVSDVLDYTMNGIGDYINSNIAINPYPTGYSNGANNLLVVSELSPPAGYDSNPFLLVMVPTSNGWAAKTYKLSNDGQYFEVEMDDRNISSMLDAAGNYTGFAIPYKKIVETLGVETPFKVSEMPLGEITTNRGPFDNNEIVNQAIRDTIDNPDIIAAPQFSTVDATNLTSQPGGLFVFYEGDSKSNSPYEIDTAVDGSYHSVSSTLDNFIGNNIQPPREGYEKRFVFYEQSAPEGYYLNPITIVMVQQDDGWHIQSYYNGTGDKSHYHPLVLNSFDVKDYFTGKELSQFLIPHDKIIDSETAANYFNNYQYESSDTPKTTYDNIITATNSEFDSYFTPGKLTTNMLTTTIDYFTKESVGGSVYQYTIFEKQDGRWIASLDGEISIDTNGNQFLNQLPISDNIRIVLREVTPPSGYVKNPIVLTLSNENSDDNRNFIVNYFQDEESEGYYLNPENGSRLWEEGLYSLVIPHIPIRTPEDPTPEDPIPENPTLEDPTPEPTKAAFYPSPTNYKSLDKFSVKHRANIGTLSIDDKLPETGEINNGFLSLLGVLGLIMSFGLIVKKRHS